MCSEEYVYMYSLVANRAKREIKLLHIIFYMRVRLPIYMSYIPYMYLMCIFSYMYICMYISYMCVYSIYI